MQDYIQKQNEKLEQWVLEINNARPTKEQEREIAQLLFDLYVTEQKKRLVQYRDKQGKAQYRTEEAGKGYLMNARYVITTAELVKHVQGKVVYGIFAGTELSKFLCFDIDYGSWKKGEKWARRVISSLLRHGIKREQIHVSFSGKKGFHIDMFFEKATNIKAMKVFYEHIVKDIEGDRHKIEFRPTNMQGVKLPMSVHEGTQTACYFVPNNTFDLVGATLDAESSIAYLQKAKENRINVHSFIDMCKKLKPTVNAIAVEHKHVKQAEKLLTHAKANIADTFQPVEDKLEYCKQLLLSRKLVYKGTRHNVTLLIGQYLKELGSTQEQTTIEVKAFITEAYVNDRSKFGEDTTIEYALGEAERLTGIVYERGYSLYNEGRKEWELFESELTFILETVNTTVEKRKFPLIQLLFAFLMESKKHAKKSNGYVFYTAYSILAKYGCTVERQALKKQIDKLVALGVLEIAKTTEQVGKHKTPYYFKVNIPKEEGDNNSLVFTTEGGEEDKKIATVIVALFTEEKARKLVSKKVYYERLKPIYKAM
ncbi:hypothetical protein HOV72_026680 [Bacillus albus]|uniref:TOTE conflict system archaeo-eukaryotic primase domain-containing protein n=1 Tax=Bacillus albus TaxID=2026189 RepID=UPI002349D9F0|nr:hypothetical protein [Bacillus albus]MDC6159387.1 hypothetical protein [Bacillus albus]MDD8008864.1 hypothetical protein [Bacillus albus]